MKLQLKLKLFISAWVFLFLSPAHAADYSFFYGLGEALSFNGSIRVGINAWEFGRLSSGSLGVVKRFKKDSVYGAFGPVLHAGSASLGLSAALGWEPHLFWGLHFRTEAIAYTTIAGIAKGEAVLGLSYQF